MGGYVCTVAGGNGGVGKTTTAINLGAAFAERGRETVIIDADLAMPNVAELLGVDSDASLHDVLSGSTTISEALTDAGGLAIIPGESSLDAYAEADPNKLPTVVNTLSRTHDVVVIDTAAGLGAETTVPLEHADGVALVTTPDHVSLTDTGKTGTLAEMVDSPILGALVVRATPETPLSGIDEEFDFPVLGGIPDDVGAAGTEPLVTESGESPAATAYRELAGELEPVFFGAKTVGETTLVPSEWTG
ncbi:P-loop NTPase [Halovenus sp. WSH3]|uniref:P-loop NTPase n=1 Tax=Halovenus carboxidivorans TaxID=2692199 RepID=A0A6B0T9X3_9EURY|nr:P-loop NTPase [Halovenus carboxidivorans]MXR52162.1 P-loop NTPase [Halovenus carboxidivorans]